MRINMEDRVKNLTKKLTKYAQRTDVIFLDVGDVKS